MTGIPDNIEIYDPFWDYLRHGILKDWVYVWTCYGINTDGHRAIKPHDPVDIKGARCHLCGTDNSDEEARAFVFQSSLKTDFHSIEYKQQRIKDIANGRRAAPQDPNVLPAIWPEPEQQPAMPEPEQQQQDPQQHDTGEDTRDWRVYLERLRDGAWHGLQYDTFCLPGFGTSKKSCGNWILEGCLGTGRDDELRNRAELAADKLHDGEGLVRRKVLSCKKISCLTCVETSVKRAANKAAERMTAFMILLQSDIFKEHRRRVFNHFVVSPKQDLYEQLKTVKDVKAYEKRILKELKLMGIDGGVMVFHPFRFTPRIAKPYFSPHWHFILSGYTHADDIKAAYEKLGAVCRCIRILDDSKDCYTVLRYLLSHTAQTIDPKTRWDSVRYFGLCQNRNFKTDSILRKASTYDGALQGIVDYITGVEYLRKGKRAQAKLRFKRVRIQKFTFCDNVLSLQSTLKTRDEVYTDPQDIKDFFRKGEDDVIDFERHMLMRSEFDGTWERTKDNVPIPKSDACEIVVMAVDAIQIPTALNSEKCEFRNYFVYYLDPDDRKLCPKCKRKIKIIQAHDPENSKWLELDLEHFAPMPLQDAHYRDQYDMFDGMQYFTVDGTAQDVGELVRNIFYGRFRPEPKQQQLDAVRDSIVKVCYKEATKYFFNKFHRKPNQSEKDAYLQERLQVGIPGWDDGKQERLMLQ